MIRIFYGENRVKINAEIKKVLGGGYEVLDGAELTVADLPSIFWARRFLPKNGRF